MGTLIKFLNGKKTYVSAALLAAVVFCYHAGIIDQNTYNQLWALLTAGGLAALRVAVDGKKDA